MRRPTSALTTAILGTALTASTLSAQTYPPAAEPPGVSPMAAARGARHLLRNGWDYIAYQEYERALAYFREAETRKSELSEPELLSLRQGIARAQQGMREATNASTPSYARSGRRRPGAFALARPAPGAKAGPTAPEPIQLASGGSGAGAPETAGGPNPAPANAPMQAKPPAPAAPDLDPIALPPLPGAPAPGNGSLPPLPEAPVLPPAPSIAPPPVPNASTEPASPQPSAMPAPAAPPTLNLETVPPLPDEPNPEPARAEPTREPAERPASTAEPAANPAETAAPPPLPDMAPTPDPTPAASQAKDSLPDPSPAPAPAPATSPEPAVTRPEPMTLPPGDPMGRPAAPAESPSTPTRPAPAPAAAPRTGPAPRLVSDRPSESLVPDRPEVTGSTLAPDLQREVERIAQRQEEDMRRGNQAPTGRDTPNAAVASPTAPSTRLEISRAPSPTEARPIRAIPVPEEFVPLAPRDWAPNRKYWAAAATCHLPLYFQDASLERYGHSTEQFFGPIGRFLSYPVDDPRQSNQRNQIAQPFFSAGLFALQIALWPYNLIMDPPWEAEYDLGYYRPGDRVPTDVYYLPLTGVGPPLQGRRY
ncbi:MAG: hypothetical protein ACM35G_00250 [Planctomycetaceae bacterium]